VLHEIWSHNTWHLLDNILTNRWSARPYMQSFAIYTSSFVVLYYSVVAIICDIPIPMNKSWWMLEWSTLKYGISKKTRNLPVFLVIVLPSFCRNYHLQHNYHHRTRRCFLHNHTWKNSWRLDEWLITLGFLWRYKNIICED
jgi:hypothetical protein